MRGNDKHINPLVSGTVLLGPQPRKMGPITAHVLQRDGAGVMTLFKVSAGMAHVKGRASRAGSTGAPWTECGAADLRLMSTQSWQSALPARRSTQEKQVHTSEKPRPPASAPVCGGVLHSAQPRPGNEMDLSVQMAFPWVCPPGSGERKVRGGNGVEKRRENSAQYPQVVDSVLAPGCE